MSVLPVELDYGRRLAHRSPTYQLKLLDGRTLTVRREAMAIRHDETLFDDTAVLAAGGGDVRWWIRIGNRECHSDTLAEGLLRVLRAQPAPLPQPEPGSDEAWEEIRLLFHAAVALVEVVVPSEPQAVRPPAPPVRLPPAEEERP